MENIRMESRNSYDENIIFWSPITAGVLIALTIGVLFDLLGLGIGCSLFSPNREVGVTLTIGTLIWLMVTSAGSMYAGGWIAGRYGDAGTSSAGAAHGLVVSSAAILIMLVVTLVAAGSLLSSSLSALQSVMSVAGSAAANAPSAIERGVDKFSRMAPRLTEKVKSSLPDLQPVIDEISRKAEEFLPETSDSSDTGSSRRSASQLDNFLPDFLNSIDNENYEEARKKLVDRLAELSGKSPEEVNRMVDEWKQKYTEAKEKVKQKTAEATKAAAKTISKIALINFFLLLIGMVAGAAGGISGVRCRFR